MRNWMKRVAAAALICGLTSGVTTAGWYQSCDLNVWGSPNCSTVSGCVDTWGCGFGGVCNTGAKLTGVCAYGFPSCSNSANCPGTCARNAAWTCSCSINACLP